MQSNDLRKDTRERERERVRKTERQTERGYIRNASAAMTKQNFGSSDFLFDVFV